MKKSGTATQGFTLMETMLVVAIFAVVASAFAIFLGKNISFFQHMKIRQKVMTESRQCMETIDKALRNGKARTLIIQTVGAVPNSSVDFDFQTPLHSGATHCFIYMQGNTVVYRESAGSISQRVLATDVTSLTFGVDYRDPAIVSVSLRIDAPLDSALRADRMLTLFLPNHIVQMVDTP